MNSNIKTLEDLYNYATSTYSNQTLNRTCDSEAGYSFESFRHRCEKLSDLLSLYGVGADAKVAIYATGQVNWSLAFFTAVAHGRIAVPILPDFSGSEAGHVLAHSGSRVLFASSRQLAKLSQDTIKALDLVISIEDLQIVSVGANGNASEVAKTRPQTDPYSPAAIIYTSGTTGDAKGVVLTHNNFLANVRAAEKIYRIGTEDVMLSILPLAHAYELSLGMLYPFSMGASVCYISKTPSPSYLMKVMQDVRPTAMLTVPLIIEKVYKGTILPMIRKSPSLCWLDRHAHTLLCRIIGKKMIKTFGGRLRFFGIGGAKLDVDVERFLYAARFPYYIGYGLTECAPLLSICSYLDTVPGSIGFPIDGVSLRLDNVNPSTGEGEIIAKGPNIMPCYYKDEVRTLKAFNREGWFRTGDLAVVDKEGRYAIKGRLGNMIVGASGENIYPEEIEKVVKEIPDVEDVIVVYRRNGLVCLVRAADSLFDFSKAQTDEATLKALNKFKTSVMDYVNKRVSVASRISKVEMMTVPFEKTATLKIRRFLYVSQSPSI